MPVMGHRAGGTGHRSVLLEESLDTLDIHQGDIVLDATLGGAGHAKEILARLAGTGLLVGLDADNAAVARARESLQGENVILIEANFRDLESYLGKHGIPKLSKALFDLGWSSYQLDAGRGFSFQKDEPLLMTYSENVGETTLTAEKVVNDWEESSLADIIYGWGEERAARRIAKRIVDARKEKRIRTSGELAAVIESAVPRKGRIHPATKTFQALRIAVNDEMGALKQGLQAAWTKLEAGGRIAVISFHSVEDREVKRLMQEWEKKGEGRKLTKKPISPSREESTGNPRSRSAKLRVMVKLVSG